MLSVDQDVPAQMTQNVSMNMATRVTIQVLWEERRDSIPQLLVTDRYSQQVLKNLPLEVKSEGDTLLTFYLDKGDYTFELSNFAAGAIIKHVSLKTSESTF